MKPSLSRSVGPRIALLVLMTASPAGAQGLSSFSAATPVDESLFFVGSDQHVHMGQGGNTASNQDLTIGSTPQGAVVFPYSSLSSFSDQMGWHVFYVGMDQHVHQLYYLSGWTPYGPAGSFWGDQDLSKLSAPNNKPACGGLASFSDVNGKHVYFAGRDFDVHLLSLIKTNFCRRSVCWVLSYWSDKDLNSSADGLPVKVDPCFARLSSLSDVGGQQEHVYYTGNDGHVHSLNWLSIGIEFDTIMAANGVGPLWGCQPQ